MRIFMLLAVAAAAVAMPAFAKPELPKGSTESPATTEMPTADLHAAIAELEEAVAELRAELLRPGARVEGWDIGGADPDGDLRALGPDSHYFLDRTSDATGVAILTSRPVRDFVPQGWRIVESYGSPQTQIDDPTVEFMPLTHRFVVAARSHSWRRKDAFCSGGVADALLLEVPDAPASEDDEIAPVLFLIVMLAQEDQVVCGRYDGTPEAGYTSRWFLPDGRLLPTVTDSEDLLTIVPAAPIETLIEFGD